MNKENLFLVSKDGRLVLKKNNNKYVLLNSNDISIILSSELSRQFFGTLEVNKETVYSLFVLTGALVGALPENFTHIDRSEIFKEELLPWERLVITQMLNGRKGIDLVVSIKDGKLMTAYDRVRINVFKAFFKHLHTVNTHRRLVRKHCFRVGLYKQGIIHDLSKYSPEEFFVGVRFYQGTRSPNVAERNITGYSSAWMHHKGRNKHHYEYLTDYNMESGNPLEYCKMPRRYLVESIMDRIAASKVYRGKDYNDGDSLDYLLTRDSESHMHKENHEELVRILTMLKEKGEPETFSYLKNVYLKEKEY